MPTKNIYLHHIYRLRIFVLICYPRFNVHIRDEKFAMQIPPILKSEYSKHAQKHFSFKISCRYPLFSIRKLLAYTAKLHRLCVVNLGTYPSYVEEKWKKNYLNIFGIFLLRNVELKNKQNLMLWFVIRYTVPWSEHRFHKGRKPWQVSQTLLLNHFNKRNDKKQTRQFFTFSFVNICLFKRVKAHKRLPFLTNRRIHC